MTLHQTPYTPTRYIRHSLALNFTESSPGQPIFDFPEPRRSISSSGIIPHSSPVAIPSSKCDASASDLVEPMTLQVGTIPATPGPFRAALERDAVHSTPSPVLSPVLERAINTGPLPTPMPGTNLTFEDIHPDIALGSCSTIPVGDAPSYFDLPIRSRCEEFAFGKSRCDDETTRRASAEGLQNTIQDCNTTSEVENAWEMPRMGMEKNLKYQQADGPEVKCSDTDSTNGSSEVQMEGIEHVVWEDDMALDCPKVSGD